MECRRTCGWVEGQRGGGGHTHKSRLRVEEPQNAASRHISPLREPWHGYGVRLLAPAPLCIESKPHTWSDNEQCGSKHDVIYKPELLMPRKKKQERKLVNEQLDECESNGSMNTHTLWWLILIKLINCSVKFWPQCPNFIQTNHQQIAL